MTTYSTWVQTRSSDTVMMYLSGVAQVRGSGSHKKGSCKYHSRVKFSDNGSSSLDK